MPLIWKIVIIIVIVFVALRLLWIRRLLTVVLGLFYVPLNALFMKLHNWYIPMWKKDKVVYICFAPFYWIFTAIVTLISVPYETISQDVE